MSKVKPTPFAAEDERRVPIMPQQCHTCPWGANGIEKTRLAQMANTALTLSQPLCHYHEIHGKAERFVCRGGMQWLAQQCYENGILEAPTLAAWEARRAADGIPSRLAKVRTNLAGHGFRTRQSLGIPTPTRLRRAAHDSKREH